MKKLFFLFLAVLLFGVVVAQDDVIRKNVTPIFDKKDIAPSYAKKVEFKGNKAVIKGVNLNIPKKQRGIDTIIFDDPGVVGLTTYDLQTNSAARSAIIEHSPNDVSVVFTQSHDNSTSFPNRGTGYGYFNGTEWISNEMYGNPIVEGNVRTGWGSLLSNGTEEFVISHGLSSGAYGRYQNIHAAMANWTGVADITHAPYLLWPRTASAGDYYYVIGCTNNEFGTNKPGFRFGRSTDAGRTWTFETPINWANIFLYASGDSYAIDARDSIVAFAIFDDWAGVHLWKSTDYGQTFTYRTICDFPVKKYNPTVGPIIDLDTNNIADTIVSTDGLGDIVIDNNGKCHVVWGRMRVLDDEIDAQGKISYFPYTDGILYWNEDMPDGVYPGGVTSPNFHDTYCAEEVDTVAFLMDLDGDGSVYSFVEGAAPDILPFGKYFCALTSMPTLAVDKYNNIIMAYTVVMEGNEYVKNTAYPIHQHYRYVWFRIRLASGEWDTTFYNLTRDDGYSEYVFPDLAPHIQGDTAFYIWYQMDDEPGLNVRGDEDPLRENYIIGRRIFPKISTSGFNKEIGKLEVSLSPNPVSDILTVETNANSKISIIDITGREVLNVNATSTTTRINVSNLQRGVYIIKVYNTNGSAESKIVKY